MKTSSLHWSFCCFLFVLVPLEYMSRKGPEVGKGMLDFKKEIFVDVKSH